MHILLHPILCSSFHHQSPRQRNSTSGDYKAGLPEVRLLYSQDQIPFPMIGRGNDHTPWWYLGTHNQDYQEVAIWRLPYVLIRSDCHFYTRYCRRHVKSTVVQIYHCTCFFRNSNLFLFYVLLYFLLHGHILLRHVDSLWDPEVNEPFYPSRLPLDYSRSFITDILLAVRRVCWWSSQGYSPFETSPRCL